MGLDCSHNAWHGAYSAFMRWREQIAKVAGLPPLNFMEGFFVPQRAPTVESWAIPTIYIGPNTDSMTIACIKRFEESLPIKWACLRESPLHELLYHSDYDGDIAAANCGGIADELEKLLPLLPDGGGGGHIDDWRQKTQQFIDGLRDAAASGEPLDFH
jgi:hypothetical protein